jgi:hypothetical protein
MGPALLHGGAQGHDTFLLIDSYLEHAAKSLRVQSDRLLALFSLARFINNIAILVLTGETSVM